MSKRLLPLIPPGLAVVQVLPTPDRVTIVAQPRSPTAACPDCGASSHSLHSRYERHLGDLPWQGRPVALRVQARRFRCPAPGCARQPFAERLPGIAAAAARRTERLGSLHGCLGLALGGEAGARLASRLAISTSADTLLRAVRGSGSGVPAPPTPRVLGVDDWAWRPVSFADITPWDRFAMATAFVHGYPSDLTLKEQVCSFHAVQAQLRAPSPYSPGQLPCHELGSLRGRAAPAG